ncbi:hypothetical protein [Pseudomonas ovata]|uniref:hypothetical protein n=1 Tax=Pseudomonas ovata TaxID=1839709 RepID=UPI001F4D92DD|nr:hypothetical protein [Pseudomonas ovata]
MLFHESTQHYFMRITFRSEEGRSLQELEEAFAPLVAKYKMDHAFFDERTQRKVILMVSRFGHCLSDLLYRWKIGVLPIGLCRPGSRRREPGTGTRHPRVCAWAGVHERQQDHRVPAFAGFVFGRGAGLSEIRAAMHHLIAHDTGHENEAVATKARKNTTVLPAVTAKSPSTRHTRP